MASPNSGSKRQRVEALLADIDEDDRAYSSLKTAHEKLQAENQELLEKFQRVQRNLVGHLSHLPRFSRYCKTHTVALEPEDEIRKLIEAHFLGSVVAHRRRREEPHELPPKLKILRVERIYNPRLQEKYLVELQDIAGLVGRRVKAIEDILAVARVESFQSLKVNEYLLYHGAPSELVERLALQGLDPRYSGENDGKMFGAGSYFAVNSSKSDIYTTPNSAGERCILLTRVCLGEAYLTKKSCPKVIRPPERDDARGPLNSIVALTHLRGGAVEHPEFIVFKETQALPEYKIWYKHEADCGCTHCYKQKVVNIEVLSAEHTDKVGTIRARLWHTVAQLRATIFAVFPGMFSVDHVLCFRVDGVDGVDTQPLDNVLLTLSACGMESRTLYSAYFVGSESVSHRLEVNVRMLIHGARREAQYKIFVQFTDTIFTLKERLEAVSTIPAQFQRVIFDGRRLIESSLVSSYEIGNGSTIVVSVRRPA